MKLEEVKVGDRVIYAYKPATVVRLDITNTCCPVVIKFDDPIGGEVSVMTEGLEKEEDASGG